MYNVSAHSTHNQNNKLKIVSCFLPIAKSNKWFLCMSEHLLKNEKNISPSAAYTHLIQNHRDSGNVVACRHVYACVCVCVEWPAQ